MENIESICTCGKKLNVMKIELCKFLQKLGRFKGLFIAQINNQIMQSRLNYWTVLNSLNMNPSELTN